MPNTPHISGPTAALLEDLRPRHAVRHAAESMCLWRSKARALNNAMEEGRGHESNTSISETACLGRDDPDTVPGPTPDREEVSEKGCIQRRKSATSMGITLGGTSMRQRGRRLAVEGDTRARSSACFGACRRKRRSVSRSHTRPDLCIPHPVVVIEQSPRCAARRRPSPHSGQRPVAEYGSCAMLRSNKKILVKYSDASTLERSDVAALEEAGTMHLDAQRGVAGCHRHRPVDDALGAHKADSRSADDVLRRDKQSTVGVRAGVGARDARVWSGVGWRRGCTRVDALRALSAGHARTPRLPARTPRPPAHAHTGTIEPGRRVVVEPARHP
ncbi:hypothetical protein C8R45DRAFT_1104081 [Mycena sanguinolenta]|nr:hypothetical protein C8R45DRAFT_1104081 [Mycena sanguinolenta]